MDPLGNFIDKSRFQKPDEVVQIQDFVKDTFNSACQVSVNDQQIVITVQGASLANSLRLELYNLQQKLNTKKRLIIRIG